MVRCYRCRQFSRRLRGVESDRSSPSQPVPVVRSKPRSANLMPSLTQAVVRSGRSGAAICRAASRIAMRIALAVRYCGTGTGGAGAVLSIPPAQPAAKASQVRQSESSPPVPICSARSLFWSVGCCTHVSAASSGADRDDGISGRKDRRLAHPHQTASRRGSKWAQNATASSNFCLADRFLRKAIAGSSVGATVDFLASSGNVSKTDRAVVNRTRDILTDILRVKCAHERARSYFDALCEQPCGDNYTGTRTGIIPLMSTSPFKLMMGAVMFTAKPAL